VIRLVVFASGEGSNLQAILDAVDAGALDARVTAVASDNPGCRALERAAARGIWTAAARRADHPDKAAFERALRVGIAPAGPFDAAVLAGYMRVAGPELRDGMPWMVNIHPSLLPAFPGLRAIERALEAGVPETGCTVHLVDEGIDTGPVLARAVVPVEPGDDAQRLRARIQAAEHRLLPAVLGWLAAGRLSLIGGRVHLDREPVGETGVTIDPKGGA